LYSALRGEKGIQPIKNWMLVFWWCSICSFPCIRNSGLHHCHTLLCLYGGGIMYWWLLSVCPSVCPVPDLKSRMEGCSKLKIGRKEARERQCPTDDWCFTGTQMSNGRLVYCDFQAESSGWLFKSPLAGGRGILWQPHYRLHSLSFVNQRWQITCCIVI